MRRICVLCLGMGLLWAPAAPARPLDKVDGALLSARSHAKLRAGPLSVAPPVDISGGRALVDVYVHGAMRRGAKRLRRLGMRVVAVSGRSPQRMVEGWLPLSSLDEVASLGLTKAVTAVPQALTNTGSVLSQGDAAHRGPQARAFGATGQGVPVGIVSDSIDQQPGGVAASQASGNLPANVQVLADDPTGDDEGRAMAEIVYDTAPGIPKILFGTGTTGPASRAANIDALVANGAKVIADDVVYLDEPFFQDGVIAQAVDRAKANGTAYFVSAGNRARQSWEGTFADAGSEANDFGGGDTKQTVVDVPHNGSLTLVLQWGEPWGDAGTDFAIDLYEGASHTIVDNEHTSATGFPMESFSIVNTGTTIPVQIGIHRVSGTGTPRLKWIANANFTFTPAEHNTNSAAIDPDAASARGSLAVAAVRHSDPGLDTVEAFSSRGPSVTRYFDAAGNPIAPDVRLKPDIAAADGVSTSLGSPFSPFLGTSASAPSAAAVGALLLSADPSMTVDQLYATMRNGAGAADCTAPGLPDADCGYGFIFADSKLFGLDTTPPSVTPALSPATPDGANGWYRQNVALNWTVSDTRSPSTAGANCAPVSLTTDTVATLTCTGTSSGGSTNQTVTIRRDGSPPTAPAFMGIKTGTFNAKRLPSAGRIGCTASDPTSGVASCKVTGYSRRPGRHTLTATATNGAGATSTTKLRYTVTPYVLRSLAVPRRISLATLRRAGLPVKFKARAKGIVALDLRLRGKRVGHTRERFRRGTNRARVRARRTGVLTLVVKATSPSASTRTMNKRVRVVR